MMNREPWFFRHTMVFIDRLWPDFSKNDLADAIREFHGRERRFGASAGSSR